MTECGVAAERPVIYAGQGVHYAKAWEGLRALAELLECPVTTSLQGKSAFPENHALSLGSGGRSVPKTVRQFLDDADVIFGIGCSFSITNYGVKMPKGKRIVHSTLDPADLYIFDEPLAGIDIGSKSRIMEAIFEGTRGGVLWVIMHGDSEFHHRFDRVLELADPASGAPAAIERESADRPTLALN